MLGECPDDVLRSISPAFRHYVQHVWKELQFGLQKSRVDVERIKTSEEESDQFCLVVPYCGKQLKWDIIFDESAPCFAPDFRFDDDTFLLDADEELLEKRVPSLHAWDASDPHGLSRVISELMALYREHQKKLLSEDESSRAFFEYSALLGDQDSTLSERDIEVWVGHGQAAQFLIRLDVNTDRLPELFSDGWDKNPGGECALLLVRFPNSSAPELLLSPLVSRACGRVSLPPMYQAGVLMDYVPTVTHIINKKIEQALTSEKLKRELISQLVVKYEGAVLQHDARSAAFLFTHDRAYYILQVDIGDNFPESKPTLTLRSVYHTSKGKPRTKVLPDCPYGNFEDYVREQAEIFLEECGGNSQQSHTNVIKIDA